MEENLYKLSTSIEIIKEELNKMALIIDETREGYIRDLMYLNKISRAEAIKELEKPLPEETIKLISEKYPQFREYLH